MPRKGKRRRVSSSFNDGEDDGVLSLNSTPITTQKKSSVSNTSLESLKRDIISALKNEISGLKNMILTLQNDNETMKTNSIEMKREITSVRSENIIIREEITSLKRLNNVLDSSPDKRMSDVEEKKQAKTAAP